MTALKVFYEKKKPLIDKTLIGILCVVVTWIFSAGTKYQVLSGMTTSVDELNKIVPVLVQTAHSQHITDSLLFENYRTQRIVCDTLLARTDRLEKTIWILSANQAAVLEQIKIPHIKLP
jgi:hypothetical protein